MTSMSKILDNQDKAEIQQLSSRQELLQLVELRLRRATTAIDGLDQRAAALFELNRTDLRLVDLLASRGPLTAGELARRAGISTGGLTAALDRLERAGYVRRQANPSDRRGVVAHLTTKVAAPARRAFEPVQQRMTEILDRYRVDELELVAGFLESWVEVMEKSLEDPADDPLEGSGRG